MMSPAGKVGILTYDDARFGNTHLEKLGIPPSRVVIRGASEGGNLRGHIQRGAAYMHEQMENELVALAQMVILDCPEITALCLECTQMPPFAEAIQTATGKPVYDIYTAGCWFYSGLVRQRPPRWGSISQDTIETRR